MELSWTSKMFLASLVGSLAGLFWPLMIAVWRKEMRKIYQALKVSAAGGPAARRKQFVAFRWARFILTMAILPFLRGGGRILFVTILAVAIASIASAVGFAAFLTNPETQEGLRRLDGVAFFAAFNYGFTASSLVEEALRQQITPE